MVGMACCADQRDELFAPIRKERIAADQERADAILHHGRERGVVRRIGVLSSLAAGAATLPAASRIARAQAYPTLPVRMIVGFAAGGGADITARLIGQWLSELLGQQFVIENRPGAASNIAAEAVVRAPADGHTLLLMVATHAVNASLFDKLSFICSATSRAGCGPQPVTPCAGGPSDGSGQERSRVYRPCQGQSEQGHDGVVWSRLNVSCRRRVV
jgi:Tripartite tricarboxylate transporter family receptor